MIKKIFYTIPQALEALGGDSGLLTELIDFHDLRFYYRLGHERANEHWDGDGGFGEDTLRASGRHDHARWAFMRRDPDPEDPDTDQSYYILNGWFELSRETTITLAAGKEAPGPCVESYKEGKRFGTFFDLQRGMVPELARVRISDLESLMAPETRAEEEKQLTTRERNNLLRIIAALAKEAKIDVVEGGKGAIAIEAAVAAAGFDGPKEKAIRKVLADVRGLD